MSNARAFLDFFDYLVSNCKEPVELTPEVQEMYDLISTLDNSSKPAFTEQGLQILEFLQNNAAKNLKAKDIADGLLVSSRKVSGAMHKLVTDGYVSKFNTTPVVYTLTDKGKNFDIISYKETMKHEED